MKIAYHNPYPNTLNAYRSIMKGFEFAFKDLGHEFRFFTPDDNFKEFFLDFKPDIFLTSTHFVYQKYLDLNFLKELRGKGLVVFVKLDFWTMPKNTNQERISEAGLMSNNLDLIEKIKSGLLGDIYYHVVEQEDARMDGFSEVTGYKYHTIPLAADKSLIVSHYKKEWDSDISFIGTNSPDKKEVFKDLLFPLFKKYKVNLFGQDWTMLDRILGWVQRFGQYFNLPILKSIRKPKLKLEDEADIYKSTKVCINIHEKNQVLCGGDCNERAFKIPAYGGFQISDNVECLRKYFREDEEIVIAKDKDDWFSKIDYYMNHPDEREKIIKAGQVRVLKDHTYHNRVEALLKIYNNFRNEKK